MTLYSGFVAGASIGIPIGFAFKLHPKKTILFLVGVLLLLALPAFVGLESGGTSFDLTSIGVVIGSMVGSAIGQALGGIYISESEEPTPKNI